MAFQFIISRDKKNIDQNCPFYSHIMFASGAILLVDYVGVPKSITVVAMHTYLGLFYFCRTFMGMFDVDSRNIFLQTMVVQKYLKGILTHCNPMKLHPEQLSKIMKLLPPLSRASNHAVQFRRLFSQNTKARANKMNL
jgi:hypothetical protein